MDVASKYEVLKQSKWNLLRHINQCRLYTKSFTLSDLTKNGNDIFCPYMDGSQRGENIHIAVPDYKNLQSTNGKYGRVSYIEIF
jgi:hypothetical protein